MNNILKNKKTLCAIAICFGLILCFIFLFDFSKKGEEDGLVSSFLFENEIEIIEMDDIKTFQINLKSIKNEEADWKSEDESIATVENGLVTAHKNGETNITVTYNNENEKISVVVSVFVEEYKNDDDAPDGTNASSNTSTSGSETTSKNEGSSNSTASNNSSSSSTNSSSSNSSNSNGSSSSVGTSSNTGSTNSGSSSNTGSSSSTGSLSNTGSSSSGSSSSTGSSSNTGSTNSGSTSNAGSSSSTGSSSNTGSSSGSTSTTTTYEYYGQTAYNYLISQGGGTVVKPGFAYIGDPEIGGINDYNDVRFYARVENVGTPSVDYKVTIGLYPLEDQEPFAMKLLSGIIPDGNGKKVAENVADGVWNFTLSGRTYKATSSSSGIVISISAKTK